MSTEDKLQANPDTDAAYTLGLLYALFLRLDAAGRFSASGDLRAKVMQAVSEAKAIREGYDKRSKERTQE